MSENKVSDYTGSTVLVLEQNWLRNDFWELRFSKNYELNTNLNGYIINYNIIYSTSFNLENSRVCLNH
jgi:hypothetical protein